MSERTTEIAAPVTNRARFKLPKGACDVAAHVIGPYSRYPVPSIREFVPVETPFEAYQQMHALYGFERGVLTQPSYYGVDNSCMLDALARSHEAAKGIVALYPEALTDGEIARLDALGIRGVRISERVKVGPRYDAIEAIGRRIRGTGWHLEIVPPRGIEPVIALRPLIEELGVPVMFDGMGKPDAKRGVGDPGFQEFLSMMRDGLIWTKLSHPNHLQVAHPYAEVRAFAQALVDANPKRCVFGLDWPHAGHQPHPPMPDDGFLLDLFPQWVPDEKLQKLILVDNPNEAYRF